jgi:hypothetical protein
MKAIHAKNLRRRGTYNIERPTLNAEVGFSSGGAEADPENGLQVFHRLQAIQNQLISMA